MSSILIKSGLTMQLDSKNEILFKYSDILIEENKIVRVGPADTIEAIDSNTICLDALGKVVLPGFICTHTHMYAELLRGAPLQITPPSDFMQNLTRIWWPLDEALTVQDAYASTIIACEEMIRNGITCFVDTYSGPNSIEGSMTAISKAVNESGLRGFISFEATQRRSDEEGWKGLKANEEYCLKTQSKSSESLVQPMSCIHASFTVSDDLLSAARELANKYHIPFTIHTSEGLIDLYHNYEKYGERTIERLNRLGVLDVPKNGMPTILTHCVQVNRDEIDLLKNKHGVTIAHNPMSNMLNAVGVMPITLIKQNNIPVGFGNDGFVWDPIENMRAGFLIHKVKTLDPRIIPASEALKMSTNDAARVIGMGQYIGQIKENYKADIIILNPPTRPTPIDPRTAAGHIVYAGRGDWVETTIVNGKILMQEKEIKTLDLEFVSKTALDATNNLWKRMGLPDV
ncbi:MAG: amidohydrolase family protein [Candidatus Thorarchaeota archaeon]